MHKNGADEHFYSFHLTRMALRFNRVPNLPFFLLCGVIGKDARQAFPIGLRAEWTVPSDLCTKSSSFLYLFANDIPFMYGNNHALDESAGGPLRVSITRIR